jgi:kynureninase
VPREGADGWQISNPPILAMAPLMASLDLFERAGLTNLREKSKALTGYLRFLLEKNGSSRFQIITPNNPDEQGCQLSILVHNNARGVLESLEDHGAVCDFREPNVIRAAPTPLYNTFHEVWRFAQLFGKLLA